jgi:hypothetical protein
MLLLWIPNGSVWMRRRVAIRVVFALWPRPRIFLAGARRYVKAGRVPPALATDLTGPEIKALLSGKTALSRSQQPQQAGKSGKA